MKKYLLFILVALASVNVLAVDSKKDLYFIGLSTTSPSDGAMFTFMLDQHLENKCNKVQTIKNINEASMEFINIYMALKNGGYSKAKTLLNNLRLISDAFD